MDLPLPVLVLYGHLLILFYLFSTKYNYAHISFFFYTCTWHVYIPYQHGFFQYLKNISFFILTQILSELESDTSRL